MRVINFFKEEEKKVAVLEDEVMINDTIHSINLKVPCKVNLIYSDVPKIVFNTDLLSLSWSITNGKLVIEKTQSFNTYIRETDSIDIYLHSKIKNLKTSSETELYSSSFMFFDHIEATDSSRIKIDCVDARSLKIKSFLDAVINVDKSKEPLNEIEIITHGDSKVYADNVHSVKGKFHSGGFSYLTANIAEEVETVIQGLSRQDIHGEPPIVTKEITGGMGHFELINKN